MVSDNHPCGPAVYMRRPQVGGADDTDVFTAMCALGGGDDRRASASNGRAPEPVLSGDAESVAAAALEGTISTSRCHPHLSYGCVDGPLPCALYGAMLLCSRAVYCHARGMQSSHERRYPQGSAITGQKGFERSQSLPSLLGLHGIDLGSAADHLR
jgi:hypothetical protein